MTDSTDRGEKFDALLEAAAAATFGTQYAVVAMLAALERKGAIDPEDVFRLLRVLADGFARNVPGAGATAEMLLGIEAVYRNLTTLPPGAGRA
jgi:hypothetical protein